MSRRSKHQPHAPGWHRALVRANQVPRRGARTRAQALCRQPAMANGRCRMHGGRSPGAPAGERNGNYRSGSYTKQAKAERRALQGLLRSCRDPSLHSNSSRRHE
jgi:hypothetical protein